MDENYLDSLLNEVSLDKEIDHKIEEELDEQIQKEKKQHQEQELISDEELFNMDLELDAQDLQTQEVHFSEEQMDELDHLDNLADLDIGDLDFSDIDFDDLDVTKLDDIETDDLDDLLKEFEGDLDIANLFETSETEENASKSSEEDTVSAILEEETEKEEIPEQTADLNEDSFDADQFLDSLLEDAELPKEDTAEVSRNTEPVPSDEMESDAKVESIEEVTESLENQEEELDLLQALEEFGGFEDSTETPKAETESPSQLSDAESDDLDDLLAMLDLEDAPSTGGEPSVQENLSDVTEDVFATTDLSDLEDIGELPSAKTEKTLKDKIMEVIFGEPDEEDILSEEELAQIEAKKAAKKQKKEEQKQAKEEKEKLAKEEKAEKNSQKQKAAQDKKLLKAQKKAQLRAEELANAEPEKKLNRPMVIFIFSLFLGGVLLLFLATNNFNYSLAIEKATNYFANQKYRKAYDEIVGVEVKEEDEDLKNRIYTVMYVERLYESYLNNVSLGRYEKALDSLLRGVTKYYEHYEEAEELGITSDLDFSFNQIQTTLLEQYGITVEDAKEINGMSNYDYVQYIQAVVGETAPKEEVTTDSGAVILPEEEDATLPSEQEEEVEE